MKPLILITGATGYEGGDVLDCWRVKAIEPDRLLRLVAEMKLAGRAVLEFQVTPVGSGSIIRQTATFDPKGLLGRAYWYAVLSFRHFVFNGMIQAIAARSLIGR
jgi:hypothetical protein